MRPGAKVVGGLAALALAAVLHGPGFASPSNDNFSAAQPVGIAPFATVLDTSSATMQAAEPQPCPVAVGKTVWYAFTAPASATFIMDTYGSDFDTILSAFTGSTIDSLHLVDCSDDTLSRNQSRLELQASAGVTYRLQIGGFNDAAGNMRLNIAPAPQEPANDSFNNPIAVTALPFADLRLNYAATLQGGESRSTCSESEKTVWYSFVPATTGQYQVDTMGSDYDTVLALYTGGTLTGLSEIACQDDVVPVQVETSRLVMTFTAGMTYRIQVGGFSAAIAGLGTDYGRLAFNIQRPIAGDTDGDGCSDVEEGGQDAAHGGGRSMYDRWDVYDVTGDGAIDLSDTAVIFQHFGHAPGNDPIDALLDRYAPDPAIPYRTSAATAENMGVDQADAIASLMSFGLKCGADSCVDTDQDGTCDTADLDDDNDGCPDARESGPDHSMGGGRDPLNGWDFFDTTGDQEINIDDALDILQYWGQPGDSPAANLRDRWIPDPSKPWRTASADDGIDGTDVLANLASFGDSCR